MEAHRVFSMSFSWQAFTMRSLAHRWLRYVELGLAFMLAQALLAISSC